MRRSPFFIALAAGLSTAALTFSGMASVTADETDVVDQAAEQATDAVDNVADTASDTADNAADTASNATENASNVAESTEATADATAGKLSTSETTVAPSASADVDSNINAGEQAQIQGGAGVQTQLDAQGQPLPSPQIGVNTGINQQLNVDQNRINAQQSGQLNTSGQLSAEQIDQRLGLQFDQTVGATAQGMRISTIQPNSVLYTSGLRQGDILLSVDNRPFANRGEFTRLITTYNQNRIPLIVMRNGQRQTIYFSRPADFVVHDHVQSRAILGVTFDPKMGGAAVVRAVTPQSPADQAGIMTGDVIIGLNGKPVSAAHEAVDMVGSMKPGTALTVDYSREQQRFRAEVTLAAATELNRHSVGYAPEASVQPVPVPAGQTVIRENTTYRVQPRVLPTNPGDPDGDGRRLDGDGRLPRRVLNRR